MSGDGSTSERLPSSTLNEWKDNTAVATSDQLEEHEESYAGTQVAEDEKESDVERGAASANGFSPLPVTGPGLLRHRTTPNGPSATTIAQDNQIYILRVCRALMMYGAPTHRLETYMQRTAEALHLNLQAFHLPGCMLISFDERDDSRRSGDVQIITCAQSLNLGKLRDVHSIYKDMIHQRTDAKRATALLDDVVARKGEHPRWLRVLMYGLASAFIGPIYYNARPIDLPLIFFFGSIVGLLDLVVTARSALYGYVFEMSVAILVSFAARGLGSLSWNDGENDFCFSAVAQASLVMILPGFTITNSALELQSRMMISGTARLVYGIIYTLFLAFGFTVGIAIYGAIDSNATSSTSCSNPWPFWWQILFVIPFTFCYVIVSQAKWRQIPVTLVVTLAGWVVDHFAAQRFATIPALSNALGALTIGVLSNLYSRLAHGFTMEVMHPAIFILVPGSFAASGSLIEGLSSANAVTHQGGNVTGSGQLGMAGRVSALYAGYVMVEIAIGITAGLSVSALLVYPIMKKKGGGGLFSY